jgi:hypothetical protein
MSIAMPLERSMRVSAAPFVATAFIGASLIFLVQPMFARMATPLLGGAPAVWNVSLVCFQAALLGGYAYAHLLSRLRSMRMQILVHAGVLAVGFLCLPLRISGLMGDPPADQPTVWLLATFTVSIAPPFAALSATAPLIQHWYARSGRADASDPYHLYAASNIGSLIGLLAYPLLIEPFATIADQTGGWTVGYIVLAAVLLFSGCSIMRVNAGAEAASAIATPAAPAPAWRDRLIWLGLSFVPSSLLVGATTHSTTDVAAAPFLWAPPLIIYLLTFVLAFSKKPLIPHELVMVLAPLVAAVAGVMLLGGVKSIAFGLGADLAALFLIALACHGMLNARRPDAHHLTQFYLIMSLGGVLGGAFNALVAPVIFSNVLEYPLMLVAGVALLGLDDAARGHARGGRAVWILMGCAVAALLAAIIMRIAGVNAPPSLVLVLIAPAGAALILSRRAPRGAALALALALPIGPLLDIMQPVWTGRSFFGVVRIVDSPVPDLEGGRVRILFHGTTIHGTQSREPDRLLTPRMYYAPSTPIGQSFRLFSDAARVGVVGLGIGSTACYRQPGQTWRFYEIDPLVVKVASDPSRFTFLSSCQPDADIVLGDARIQLAAEPAGRFDLLLLDAFSSDSVPTHLLTAEAMRLYLDRMSADGVLVVHISNRHLSLRQVVTRVADASGAKALWQFYSPTKAELAAGASASEVVMISRSDEKLARAKATGLWQDIVSDGGRPWTDDYSNIIGAMIVHAQEQAERDNAKRAGSSED